jgi:hypothetical protein
MPKLISRKAKKKFKPTWYKATVHSTNEFWNTKAIISDGKQRYPLGNAYILDEQGFRVYLTRFPKGATFYIDPERTTRSDTRLNTKTGRELLQRFYDLKLAPLVFKWIKAKTPLETAHWICVYPVHYLVIVEKSEKGMHVDDHEATLYYRGTHGLIAIARQLYEGHLKGNSEYDQPSILQEELREWRLTKAWFQDAITREERFEV